MNDKIKIIYLESWIMTKSKWFSKEMNYLEKNSDVEIHELCDFLFPKKVRKMFKETYKSEKIFTFKTLSDWKKHVLDLQKKCFKEGKRLVIFNEFTNYPTQGFNLRYLQINKFLKQNQIDYYEFSISGQPIPKASIETYLKFIKTFKYWRYLLVRLNEFLVYFVGNLLDLKPKGIFVAGRQARKRLENIKKARFIELINFNTWEYSLTLNKKSNDSNLLKEKYAVFINMTTPQKRTDEEISNLHLVETAEKWYPALNNFFSYLEKIFNLKIIIAAHPKSDEDGFIDYLGNRRALLDKTEELIRGSEFVISGASTAVAFAVVYKKPIFFIYSNESKADEGTFRAVNSFSDYFETKSINIDESVSESQIKSIINFNEKLYENFKIDFLSSNPKNQNYQIVLEHLNK